MAKKLGNQTYPDTIPTMMSDGKLGPVFRAFVKSRYADENTAFLDANYDPKKMYNTFIKSGAPREINIAHTLRHKAERIGETADWKHRDWKGIIRNCANTCETLLDSNFKLAFWSSKPFLAHHAARVTAKMTGDPKKAAKLLGIGDVKTLTDLIFNIAAGFDTEAAKLSDKLVKAEKLKMKSAVLMRELKRAGLA